MANFEREKSSTNILNNSAMSDDEVVASDLPPRYLSFETVLLIATELDENISLSDFDRTQKSC